MVPAPEPTCDYNEFSSIKQKIENYLDKMSTSQSQQLIEYNFEVKFQTIYQIFYWIKVFIFNNFLFFNEFSIILKFFLDWCSYYKKWLDCL